MTANNKLITYLLVPASITFWLAWFLMPDPGTTDTLHILNIVKASRINVCYSVIIQIISSVLYIVALFLLAQRSFAKSKITFTGIFLVAIGAMGLCADAFFHLLAFFMTDDRVSIQQDVIRVMEFMQTTGVVFLIPLLLPLFIGSLVLAIGLKKQDKISKVPAAMFIISFSIGIIGGILTNAVHFTVPGLSLIVLGIFAAGQAVIGIQLSTDTKRQTTKILSNSLN